MADISYLPQFNHVLWQDNVDRVEAGGDNGFNTRFKTIEGDLQQMSTVVTQIDAALDELSARPPSVTLSLTPAFQRVGTANPWILDARGTAAVAGENGANGLLPLTLPDQVRLVSLRIRGRGTSFPQQNTSVTLVRVAVADGAFQNVTSFSTDTVPLNSTHTLPTQATNQVDLTTFRYVLTVNTGAATGDPVTLFSVQLTYSNT